jgi:RNA polymerase sigma-70 factor (sigma-E family)
MVMTMASAQHPTSGAVLTMTVPTSTLRDQEFTAYMHARQQSLLRTAYLLTGDSHAAEDLVQTALAKLYLSWDKVDNKDSIDGYIRRIMVNENNSLWRRPWRRREVSTQVFLDGAAPEPAVDAGTRSRVWDLVKTLPPKQRTVLVLRYYESMTEAEIAAVMKISVGTVKSQASRALTALRSNVSDFPDLNTLEG